MAKLETSNSCIFSTFPQFKEPKQFSKTFLLVFLTHTHESRYKTHPNNPFSSLSSALFFPMAVFSRYSGAATAATTLRQTAATFSYIARTLSSSSSHTLNSQTDLNRNSNKPDVLGTLKRDPKGRNVQWVFLGCPGVGKGTYASRLSNLLGVPHIATGDLVRDELASSGPLSSQVLSSSFLDIEVS